MAFSQNFKTSPIIILIRYIVDFYSSTIWKLKFVSLSNELKRIERNGDSKQFVRKYRKSDFESV